MLDRTTTTSDFPVTTAITGRDLLFRRRRLSPRQRAALASDLITGRVELTKLTRRQASLLVGVCLPLVNASVRGVTPPSKDAVAAWWRTAPFNERVELVRSFGVADTWDALEPLVS
jgi:hypothetical protein